jgi:hypothetical protein
METHERIRLLNAQKLNWKLKGLTERRFPPSGLCLCGADLIRHSPEKAEKSLILQCHRCKARF